MDNDIIRAYIWDEVIRLGFSPSGGKNMLDWIRTYGLSLQNFWEEEEIPFRMKKHENGQVNIEIFCKRQACMDLELSMTNLSTHNTRFLHNPPERQGELMWVHGVDLANYFFFPERSLLNKYGKRDEALSKINDYHIEAVVDGLICHPHTHQHIESPIDEHEIRIGGGISNPFLFLFHLRYQLCPMPEKRQRERRRLISLFKESIARNNSSIHLRLLMAEPE